MKITLPQLTQQLAHSLAPLYLVSGDETLLVEEALQTICLAAEKKGYIEKQRLNLDSSDWAQLLYQNTHSLSLFSDKKIIELDLSQVKLTAAHTKLFQEIALHPLPDTLLILRAKKLDSKTQQSAWYKAVEKTGTVVQIWPIPLQQLPTWITQRAKKFNVTLTPRAAMQLATFCEGNLLAAAQEIEKLRLLKLTQPIDEKEILALFQDNTHFDIYNLVESVLLGQSSRALQILNQLYHEGVEPVLILWTLTNEIRLMHTLIKKSAQGTPLASLFTQYKIWEKRQAPIQQFLRRSKIEDCWTLLSQASQTDRVIKGIEQGSLIETMQCFVLMICNLKTAPKPLTA